MPSPPPSLCISQALTPRIPCTSHCVLPAASWRTQTQLISQLRNTKEASLLRFSPIQPTGYLPNRSPQMVSSLFVGPLQLSGVSTMGNPRAEGSGRSLGRAQTSAGRAVSRNTMSAVFPLGHQGRQAFSSVLVSPSSPHAPCPGECLACLPQRVQTNSQAGLHWSWVIVLLQRGRGLRDMHSSCYLPRVP